MPSHSSQHGFTLIELVIVIVLLGIVGAVATAKFQDLSHTARIAFIQGVQGSISSATTLVLAQAAIEGVDDGSIDYAGTSVDVRSGYPRGHWNRTWRYILITSSSGAFTPAGSVCTGYPMCGVGNRGNIPGVSGTTGGRGIIIWLEGDRINDNCFAYYYNREDGTSPLIGTVISGC